MTSEPEMVHLIGSMRPEIRQVFGFGFQAEAESEENPVKIKTNIEITTTDETEARLLLGCLLVAQRCTRQPSDQEPLEDVFRAIRHGFRRQPSRLAQ